MLLPGGARVPAQAVEPPRAGQAARLPGAVPGQAQVGLRPVGVPQVRPRVRASAGGLELEQPAAAKLEQARVPGAVPPLAEQRGQVRPARRGLPPVGRVAAQALEDRPVAVPRVERPGQVCPAVPAGALGWVDRPVRGRLVRALVQPQAARPARVPADRPVLLLLVERRARRREPPWRQ